jgi:hypothetical protein
MLSAPLPARRTTVTVQMLRASVPRAILIVVARSQLDQEEETAHRAQLTWPASTSGFQRGSNAPGVSYSR